MDQFQVQTASSADGNMSLKTETGSTKFAVVHAYDGGDVIRVEAVEWPNRQGFDITIDEDLHSFANAEVNAIFEAVKAIRNEN